MDCQTALARLDVVTSSFDDDDVRAVRMHVASCPNCLSEWRRRQRFESDLRHDLLNVPIPAGLKDRLLAACEEAIPPQPAAATKRSPAGWRTFWPAAALLVILGLGTLTWFGWTQDVPIAYASAEEQLLTNLEDAAAWWSQLPEFDDSFSLTSLDSAIRPLAVGDPRGLDVDQRDDHEAAAYRFSYRRWRGTLIVLNTEEFADVPTETLPQPLSTSSSFAWTSADGSRRYVCVVETGSAVGLMRELFGRMA